MAPITQRDNPYNVLADFICVCYNLTMTIIGFDPGTARIGWGIVEDKQPSPKSIAYGLIETPKTMSMEKRLESIYDHCIQLLDKYHPDAASIEELYFQTNAKTAISVGQARGVILLSCAQKDISVVSYSPLTVKRTVCGVGSAEKHQVQYMIKTILHLPTIPQPDDVADALALAVTHTFSWRMKGQIQ